MPGLEALTTLLVRGVTDHAAAVMTLRSKGLGHEAAPDRRLHKHAGLRKAADAAGYQYGAEAADAVRDAVIPSNPAHHYNCSSRRRTASRMTSGGMPIGDPAGPAGAMDE